MTSVLRLPDDVLRLVHSYLLPPRGSYCCLRDKGAPLRCACKIAHTALQEDVPCPKRFPCVSVQSLLSGRYEELCTKLSYDGRVYARERLERPSDTCVVHDCCERNATDSAREEVVDAMRALSEQALAGENVMKYFFSSWSSLGFFHEALRKAKVKLASKYRPVVTRAEVGIRVSWINPNMVCTIKHKEQRQ